MDVKKDKTGRKINEGDIIHIDNIGAYGVRDDGVLISLSTGVTYAFLKDIASENVKVVGRMLNE